MYYSVIFLLILFPFNTNIFCQTIFDELRNTEKNECKNRFDARIREATEWKYDNYEKRGFKSRYTKFGVNGVKSEIVQFSPEDQTN